MKIIVLTGESNKGKTSVLRLVHEKLVLNVKGKSTGIEHLGAKDTRDFFDIVVYKGKKIAIYTMGDFPDWAPGYWEKVTSASCDLVICAWNDDKFDSAKLNGSDYTEIKKALASSSTLLSMFEANLFDCYRILALIDEWLKGGVAD